MSELFSDKWTNSFHSVWNAGAGIAVELKKTGFKSTIGYGFKGDEKPLGGVVVEDCKAASAGSFNGEEQNWDLRADKPTREKWISKPSGMMGMGMAYTSKKLQFLVGDYGAMRGDPLMASPFIKGFAAMGKA